MYIQIHIYTYIYISLDGHTPAASGWAAFPVERRPELAMSFYEATSKQQLQKTEP